MEESRRENTPLSVEEASDIVSAEWSYSQYDEDDAFQYHLERYKDDLGSCINHEKEFYCQREVNV